MKGPDGRPVEAQESTALEDVVDDGLREVVVVEYASPSLQRLFVVKIIERCLRCRSSTTWKSMLAASVR